MHGDAPPAPWPAAAVERAPVGVALIDVDGRFTRCNPGLAQMLAPSGGDLVGRLWIDLVDPAARQVLEAALVDVARTGEGTARVEAAHRGLDGAEVWLLAVLHGLGAGAVPGEAAATVHFTDATVTRRHRGELIEVNRRLRSLFANLPGLIYRCLNDRLWTMEFMSDGSTDLVGYRPEEFIGDGAVSLTELIHPDDVEAVWEQVQAALASRQRFHLAYRLRTRLGQEKWVWEQGEGVYGADGELLALEGHIVDITDERRAREALRESRENLSIVLDSIGDAVLVCDARGLVTLINPVASQLTGWRVADALGLPLAEVARLVGRGGAPPPELDAAARDAPTGGIRADLVDRAGRRHAVACTVAPMRGRDGERAGLVLVARDVTEQLVTEERLRHGQRMEAIGRLAGGVAHDFNNLLAGIMGYADLLRLELAGCDPTHPHLQYVDVILETSQRAAELTQQLLAYSRRQQLAPAELDLHAVIRAAIALLRRTIDPRVAIEEALDAPWTTVSGDRAALQNALLNIGLNARDAMPGGGTLTFATRAVDLDEAAGAALSPALPAGLYLELSIRDTGPGLDAASIDRIFEPFFTSKPVGQGTGLGLAAVYGTITGHGGAVRAGNAEGGGAVFTLHLPLVAASTPPAPAPGGDAPETGTGRVLVADDEGFVRRLLTMMLTSLGYTVETAVHGADAVARFAVDPASWALVILDLQMPTMGGLEALDRLAALRPDVPVLIASGHQAEPMSAPQIRGFIQKPFNLAKLSRSVADAIRR